MLTHHFLTVALISSCYSYHHTRVGNLILILMDVVDPIFSVSLDPAPGDSPYPCINHADTTRQLAKCLRYARLMTLCDIVFGFFMLSWAIARHVIYVMVCWSIYNDTPDILTTGCFTGTNANLEGPFPTPSGYGYLIEPYINRQGLVCYNQTVKWASWRLFSCCKASCSCGAS